MCTSTTTTTTTIGLSTCHSDRVTPIFQSTHLLTACFQLLPSFINTFSSEGAHFCHNDKILDFSHVGGCGFAPTQSGRLVTPQEPLLVNVCGYKLATDWQNFTEIYLARVKILQKVFVVLLFWLTLWLLSFCKSRYIQSFWWDGPTGSEDFYEELVSLFWYWSLRNWKTESILECDVHSCCRWPTIQPIIDIRWPTYQPIIAALI